jgi:hypothetical protein
MLFSRQEDLEDRIIRLALGGRVSVKALHAELAVGGKLSLRAVYKAVDKLIEAGVLLKAGKRVLVDEEWARRVGEQLRTPGPFTVPSSGEHLAYTFRSLAHLDAFWKTVVLPIEEASATKEIFFYNPHNFWAYMPERKESEAAYYAHFSQNQHGFLTLGGETELDKQFKREFQSEYFQIDTREVPALRRSDHLTLIDSLILTVRLPRRLTARIDELYASGREVKDMLPELLAACGASGNTRFTLENSPAKAAKLKKLLSKNFYFAIN